MSPSLQALLGHPTYRRQLLAVAAILVAIAGFLVCVGFGHWAKTPDPSIGRTFPIPSRRGMSYVTLPGFVGVLFTLAGLVYVSFNWPPYWGRARDES